MFLNQINIYTYICFYCEMCELMLFSVFNKMYHFISTAANPQPTVAKSQSPRNIDRAPRYRQRNKVIPSKEQHSPSPEEMIRSSSTKENTPYGSASSGCLAGETDSEKSVEENCFSAAVKETFMDGAEVTRAKFSYMNFDSTDEESSVDEENEERKKHRFAAGII